MFLHKLQFCLIIYISSLQAVQYFPNPTSDMSADDKVVSNINTTSNKSELDESSEETNDAVKDKQFLIDAMKTVLDPEAVIVKNNDKFVQKFKIRLNKIDKGNRSINLFMNEMDELSLDVCKTSQEALWSYVTDIGSESKKSIMINIAAEEDEIKKSYWTILKDNYDITSITDSKLQRKIRIIKERGTSVQMPQSKQREEIDSMQKIWSRVSVCAYNSSTCIGEESVKTMGDIITIFKTSNSSNELTHYWKEYRDNTGKKIRPIFKDYVNRMNNVAKSEHFSDAGDMWRFIFEDDDFLKTVSKLWNEIKPFYNLLHEYVRFKLMVFYKDDLTRSKHSIPAHILGNLWAQEWQAIYTKVAAFPNHHRTKIQQNNDLNSKVLFDVVDKFHLSLGFESAHDSYEDINETVNTANCLPSSHDMCDGVHYKIKWCGEKITDVAVGLSRASRLLGHVQYFKHYSHLQPLYRDGPNPAFHDAISDIFALQLASPDQMKKLNITKVDNTYEAKINHLLWIALEKFPLMAYAYALDTWRWDIFANSTLENWNQHWWDLRTKETGVSPPVPRSESDLDPAAKYHVVSHVQYITYLISHVLEFQILAALCKKANHTGPLHECSIYGVKEAGKLLSDGMSLGASEDWRTVLKAMTGETDINTEGILKYFAPLEKFLKEENAKLSKLYQSDMDFAVPTIIGVIVSILCLFVLIMYCIKKNGCCLRILKFSSLCNNGSLDIVNHEASKERLEKIKDHIEIKEDKV